MPGFISHTIMAKDVYDKLNPKNVNFNYMITYSLGGDLSKYSKCRWETHHIKQEEFINNMSNYIKKNNLNDDKEIMGVLYGHICHLVMDNMLHPYIRKLDKECIENKNNHTLIEGYIDSYLVKNKYELRIDKYNYNSLFKGRMNKKIVKMINYTYYQTYNINNLSIYYRFNIFLYKKIKYLYKIIGIKQLKQISGFNKFINKNINIFKHNDKEISKIYDNIINETINYINNINICLGAD